MTKTHVTLEGLQPDTEYTVKIEAAGLVGLTENGYPDLVLIQKDALMLGSEMSGGIEDVRIWDCDMSNGKYGVEIKGTKNRGGYVRDLHVSDCMTLKSDSACGAGKCNV